MENAKLDAALAAVGWQFDAAREQFTDGKRRIDYRRVLALVPHITMNDLADYVNDKHEAWLATQPPEK